MHFISCIFQRIFRKTPVLKISDDSQKKSLIKFFFKQFKLSNLSPTTIPKTDSITNVFVSVLRIFKIAMSASRGETTSKLACEISAFYNFV